MPPCLGSIKKKEPNVHLIAIFWKRRFLRVSGMGRLGEFIFNSEISYVQERISKN